MGSEAKCRCGASLRNAARFCPKCGKQVHRRYFAPLRGILKSIIFVAIGAAVSAGTLWSIFHATPQSPTVARQVDAGRGQTLTVQALNTHFADQLKATRVVYLCDATGSMMSVFWRVKDELRKAIGSLNPDQTFNIIFFSDVDVSALSKTGLLMATPENKRKALGASDKMTAAGTTEPLPAIRLAFEQNPDLIYVLSDGFDQDEALDAIVTEFNTLNSGKEVKVKVNTILLRSRVDPKLERVMQLIAKQNNGTCFIINPEAP